MNKKNIKEFNYKKVYNEFFNDIKNYIINYIYMIESLN